MAGLATCMLTFLLAPVSDVQLLVFSSQNCPPCRQMAPIVEHLRESGYPITKIDAATDPVTAQQYGVSSIPCFVMVANGQIVDRVVGATSMDTLVEMYRKVGYGQQQVTTQPSIRQTQGHTTTQRQYDTRTHSQTSEQGYGTSLADRVYMTTGTDGNSSASMTYGRTKPTETVRDLTPAMEMALAATVRLRIYDQAGTGVGTGTIVHRQGEEALVLTCGHLFRDSRGDCRIEVEYGFPGRTQIVEGMLLDYEAEIHDTALVVIRPTTQFAVAQVALPNYRPLKGDQIFSVGCDRGADPTVRQTQLKALTHYSDVEKYDIFGRPVDGRSGGGLFTSGGQLIGVCNAAAVEIDEGIYAGMQSVHTQLANVGLANHFENKDRLNQLPNNRAELIAQRGEVSRGSQSRGSQGNFSNGQFDSSVATLTPQQSVGGAPTRSIQATNAQHVNNRSNLEVVVLLRDKDNPGRVETIVIENPTPELMRTVTQHAAIPQQGSVHRQGTRSNQQQFSNANDGRPNQRSINNDWDSIQPPSDGRTYRAQSPR